MNEKEIENSNKLIAVFMGYKELTKLDWHCLRKKGAKYQKDLFWIPAPPIVQSLSNNDKEAIHISKFQYHSDWNQLMPVVEKIYSMNFNDNQGFTIDGVHFMANEIEVVYKTVLQFINWHKSQSK